MKNHKKIIILTGILFLIFFSNTAYAEMRVWSTGDSVKVKPADVFESSNYYWSDSTKTVTLKGAKNEYLGFQVITNASGENLSNVNVAISDLSNDSNIISNSNMELFKELYITVSTGSYQNNSLGPGEYPDALVPFNATTDGAPFNVTSGRNQPVWVDLFIPKNTPAGNYTGTITITAASKSPITLTLNLTVWDFTIPDEIHLNIFWHLYQGDIQHLHNLPDTWAADPRTIWDVEKEYFKMAHKHRAQAIPRYGREVRTFDAQGNLNSIDWTAFDATFGTAIDGSLYDDGIGQSIWEVINFGEVWPTYPAYELSSVMYNQIKTEAAAIVSHFASKGWNNTKLFSYITDEPPTTLYNATQSMAAALYEGSNGAIKAFPTEQPFPIEITEANTWAYEVTNGPDLWTRSHATTGQTNSLYPNWVGNANAKIQMFCPNARHFIPSDPYLTETQATLHAAGLESWVYQECEPWIGNQVIDTDGFAFRMWPWAAWKYDVDGMFLWAVNTWSQATSSYVNPAAVFTNPVTYNIDTLVWNGNGVLFYPGTLKGINGPLSSVRMKQFRRGMFDYEYMWLLNSLGDKAYADTQVGGVITKAFNSYLPSTTLAANAGANVITVTNGSQIIATAEGYDNIKIFGATTAEDEVTSVVSRAGNVCTLVRNLQYSHTVGQRVSLMYEALSWQPAHNFNSVGQWSRTPSDWEQARTNMAQRIIELYAANPGGGGGGGGGGGCFIASAVFDSKVSSEISVLSNFRDRYLLNNKLGKKFVEGYYKISPPVADYLRQHRIMKKLVRELLRPIIWIVKKTE